MLNLIDPNETFTLTHPSGAVFTVKHWLVGMQDQADEACLIKVGGETRYDTVKFRKMMIDLCVVGWTGIQSKGVEVPCTSENKDLLPVGVLMWIQKEIEEAAGLRMSAEEKKK